MAPSDTDQATRYVCPHGKTSVEECWGCDMSDAPSQFHHEPVDSNQTIFIGKSEARLKLLDAIWPMPIEALNESDA